MIVGTRTQLATVNTAGEQVGRWGAKWGGWEEMGELSEEKEEEMGS